jgi:hypothetical protein
MSVLSGCVTVQSISVSPIPAKAKRDQQVTAEEHGVVVLWIPFGTNYVEKAVKELSDKCPGKAVRGVLAKYESVAYPFVSIPTVKLSGYCS